MLDPAANNEHVTVYDTPANASITPSLDFPVNNTSEAPPAAFKTYFSIYRSSRKYINSGRIKIRVIEERIEQDGS